MIYSWDSCDPDNRVKMLATEFVALKLDAEKGGASLAEKFGVEAYPTIMFVDGNGTVVKKVEGYEDGRAFTATLAQLLQTRSGAQLNQAAQSNPNDVALQARLAIINAAQGKITEAKPFLQKVQSADAKNQTGALGTIYQTIASYYFGVEDYSNAIEYLKKQVSVSNDAGETIFAQLMLSVSYISLGKKAEAIKTANAVLKAPQADKEAKELASKIIAAAKEN